MDIFKGPLGSHRNYIQHMALENCSDYNTIHELHKEQGRNQTPDKYKEFRYFLNAMESLNNILEYYYYENENTISHSNIHAFKLATFVKYPVLQEVADIANAYKHCIRENRQGKQTDKTWARDLQKPELNIAVDLSKGVNVEYVFHWPIESHEETLTKAFSFWLNYLSPESEVDLSEV